MAQYNIHHTCGHEETVQTYGTNVHGERTRKAGEAIITAMLAETSAKTIIDNRLDLVSHYGAVAQQAAN